MGIRTKDLEGNKVTGIDVVVQEEDLQGYDCGFRTGRFREPQRVEPVSPEILRFEERQAKTDRLRGSE